MKTLESALLFATEVHAGQTRKGIDEPYILHPIRVMLYFTHESMTHRIVAILHDVIEDSEWTMEWFRASWDGDPRVPDALDAMTRRGPKHPAARESYEAYIGRVAANDVAVSVKLADIKDNIRDPWWAPRGAYERYLHSYQLLHAVATERHLLIP